MRFLTIQKWLRLLEHSKFCLLLYMCKILVMPLNRQQGSCFGNGSVVLYVLSFLARPQKGGSVSNRSISGVANQKGTKTAPNKSVTPRHSTSATPGSSRHSTPHHSISDDYTPSRNPSHSARRENMLRSSASPGISIFNILELDSCYLLKYARVTHYTERYK